MESAEYGPSMEKREEPDQPESPRDNVEIEASRFYGYYPDDYYDPYLGYNEPYFYDAMDDPLFFDDLENGPPAPYRRARRLVARHRMLENERLHFERQRRAWRLSNNVNLNDGGFNGPGYSGPGFAGPLGPPFGGPSNMNPGFNGLNNV